MVGSFVAWTFPDLPGPVLCPSDEGVVGRHLVLQATDLPGPVLCPSDEGVVGRLVPGQGHQLLLPQQGELLGQLLHSHPEQGSVIQTVES